MYLSRDYLGWRSLRKVSRVGFIISLMLHSESSKQSEKIEGDDVNLQKVTNNLLDFASRNVPLNIEKKNEYIPDRSLIIRKNDSIQRNVLKIILLFETSDNPILISATSPAIAKLLAIIEISKSSMRTKHPELKLWQYNKICRNSISEPISNQSSNNLLISRKEDELAALSEILSNKIRHFPVLHVILSRNELLTNKILSWTSQK